MAVPGGDARGRIPRSMALRDLTWPTCTSERRARRAGTACSARGADRGDRGRGRSGRRRPPSVEAPERTRAGGARRGGTRPRGAAGAGVGRAERGERGARRGGGFGKAGPSGRTTPRCRDRGGHRRPRPDAAGLRLPAPLGPERRRGRRLRLRLTDPPLRAAPGRRGQRPRPRAAPRRAPPALVRVDSVNGQEPEGERAPSSRT